VSDTSSRLTIALGGRVVPGWARFSVDEGAVTDLEAAWAPEPALRAATTTGR
jgi:hypothetical protein